MADNYEYQVCEQATPPTKTAYEYQACAPTTERQPLYVTDGSTKKIVYVLYGATPKIVLSPTQKIRYRYDVCTW